MTTPTKIPTKTPPQPAFAKTEHKTEHQTERRAEPTPLSGRYGCIGIEAVAAAARYADRRSTHTAAPRIDLRFVESAS